MSRLMKLNIEEENSIVQKTVRIPSELYKDIERLMQEANIDSFNRAVVELFRLEVQEWKNAQLNQSKTESKKEAKKSQKKSSKKDGKKDSKVETLDGSKDENKKE